MMMMMAPGAGHIPLCGIFLLRFVHVHSKTHYWLPFAWLHWGTKEGKTESWEKCLFTLSFFDKKTLLWKSDQKCLLFSNNFSQLKDTFCPLTSTIFYDFIYGCILTLIYGYRFLDLCQGFRTKFLGQYGKKLVIFSLGLIL